jgi:predicted MFS family arabinose efflux permease
LAQRVNTWIFLKYLCESLATGVLFVYLPDFLSHDKGLSVQRATLVTTVIGLGALLGILYGGFQGQRLVQKSVASAITFCTAATMLAILPLYVLMHYPIGGAGTPPLAALIAAGMLAGFFFSTPDPTLKAALLSANPPELRGLAFSLYKLAVNVGNGLGPAGFALLVYLSGQRSVGLGSVYVFLLLDGLFTLRLRKSLPGALHVGAY